MCVRPSILQSFVHWSYILSWYKSEESVDIGVALLKLMKLCCFYTCSVALWMPCKDSFSDSTFQDRKLTVGPACTEPFPVSVCRVGKIMHSSLLAKKTSRFRCFHYRKKKKSHIKMHNMLHNQLSQEKHRTLNSGPELYVKDEMIFKYFVLKCIHNFKVCTYPLLKELGFKPFLYLFLKCCSSLLRTKLKSSFCYSIQHAVMV